MIANVFSKTSPLNYITITVISIFFYSFYQFSKINEGITGWIIAQKIAIMLLLSLSFIFINYISQKNNLTKLNSYTLLLYCLFFILFPSIYNNPNVVIANLFILQAVNKLVALKNLKQSKEKIFDASFWIFMAAIFHFWCILFILLVFTAIIFHVSRDYRNWIIPFIALFAVCILVVLYQLIFMDNLLLLIYDNIKMSFNFSYFENVYQNIALAVFSSVAIFIFISQTVDLGNKPLNMQSTFKKIILMFVLALLIYVLSNHKNNSFLIYSFTPLAIFGANFIEKIKTNWMKEVTLYLFIAICITLFFMQL
jgi:hypothetical protein